MSAIKKTQYSSQSNISKPKKKKISVHRQR